MSSAQNTVVNTAWQRLTEKVTQQSWPIAALYVVATPIGNLADLSLRAQHALLNADVIAAEDTRSTKVLLDAWGVGTPMMAAHRHNEAQAAQQILDLLAQGKRVALVSDAGTPAVSDPGARVVNAVRNAGYAVVPIPGVSAAMTALMASGVTSDENPTFIFAGFAPHKSVARQQWLRQWCFLPAPVVIYESPHRMLASLADLLSVCGAQREITIARELTKRFEELAKMPLEQAQSWIQEQSGRLQGEFVLIVSPAAQVPSIEIDAKTLEIMHVLLESMSVKDASKLGARLTGVAKATLYSYALSLKTSDNK